MCRLSVNVNKIATLRNARGGDVPNLIQVVQDCERFGAQGITVHPRPDQRHIRYDDVSDIQPLVKTEFNIEGYPSEEFINLVLQNAPHQVTLVPDSPEVLTSNAGWDTLTNKDLLIEVIKRFKDEGIRTSLFIETDEQMIEGAAETGADRVELYTEQYAIDYAKDRHAAVAPYAKAAEFAKSCGLGVNAGHDLNLNNLSWFNESIPVLEEVSIGHALVADALYFGLENTIAMYLRCLRTLA